MATLAGRKIKDTYGDLVRAEGGIDSLDSHDTTAVEGGLGNATPLRLNPQNLAIGLANPNEEPWFTDRFVMTATVEGNSTVEFLVSGEAGEYIYIPEGYQFVYDVDFYASRVESPAPSANAANSHRYEEWNGGSIVTTNGQTYIDAPTNAHDEGSMSFTNPTFSVGDDSGDAYLKIEYTGQANQRHKVIAHVRGSFIPYVADLTSQYSQAQELIASDGASSSPFFGGFVGLSTDGNYLIANAGGKDSPFSNAGGVYIFKKDGGGDFQETQIIDNPETSAAEYFGGYMERLFTTSTVYYRWNGVAIDQDGDTAVIGLVNKDRLLGSNTGSAFIYTRSGETWTQDLELEPWDNAAGGQFGSSVAMANDGNLCVVGAHLNNTTIVENGVSNTNSIGAAYVFRNGQIKWLQQQEETASDAQSSDYFGHSVAVSNDGLASVVGAYAEDTPSSGAGAAYIFTRATVNDSWIEQQKIQGSDLNGSDRFGWSVGISGDGEVVAVGAQREDHRNSEGTDQQTDQGSAYIFEKVGSTWSETAKLVAPDGRSSDYYGQSIAVSNDGSIVVVGAYLHDIKSGETGISTDYTDAGAAWVYRRNQNQWVQTEDMFIGTGVSGDEFGWDVSLSGNGLYAVVGAPDDDDLGTNAGAAYVFHRTSLSSPWVEQQKLLASDGAGGSSNATDEFGYSVAIDQDGDTIIVGAQLEDGRNVNGDGSNYWTNAGAAYIFTRSGATWTEQKKLVADDRKFDGSNGLIFGYSVDINDAGTRVVVGSQQAELSARENGVYDAKTGAAYVFNYDTDAWVEQQKVWPADAAASDQFSDSSAMSNDGLYCAVTAPEDGSQVGAVYMFHRATVNDNWTEQQKLVGTGVGSSDRFGRSVAIDADGDTIAVGCDKSDVGGATSGEVFIFTRTGATWTEEQALQSSDLQTTDQFGRGVGLSADGDTLIAGSSRENSPTDGGAAYIFTRTAGSWTEQQKIESSDLQASDVFGQAVAINAAGDRVVVGARGEDTGGSANGAVYAFDLIGGTWTETQKIQSADGSSGQNFGWSVGLNNAGDRLIVGARYDNEAGTDNGAAYIFDLIGSTWTEQEKLLPRGRFHSTSAYFGWSVVLSGDGTKAFVGCPQEDSGANSNGGAVFYYELDGSEWKERLKWWPEDLTASDNFGQSVATDATGSVLFVGALQGNNGSNDSGTGYFFEQELGWHQVQKLWANDALTDDDFGDSVAIDSDGDTILIGAPTKNSSEGAAYVFKLSGGEWTEYQKIEASDVAVNQDNLFGSAVSLNAAGTKAAIGAEGHEPFLTSNSRGGAYTFDLVGGTWVEEQIIVPRDGQDSDVFGRQLSLNASGDTLIVGAQGQDNPDLSGRAYVFEDSGTEWKLNQILIANNFTGSDRFGCAVDITDSGSDTFIGAYSRSGVYSFQLTTSNDQWREDAKLVKASNWASSDYFGWSVAVDADGDTIAVGVQRDDNAGNSNEGAAYVFKYSGGEWSQDQALFPSDGATGNDRYFGTSIDISNDGTRVVVGAYLDDETTTNTGAAYVYEETGGTWTEMQKLRASDGRSSDYFGWDVSISGDGLTIAVGASDNVSTNGNDSNGTNNGAVYIYTESGGTWTQFDKMMHDTTTTTDCFGGAVDLDETAAVSVIGASYNDTAASNAGSVFFFEPITGQWRQEAKLVASDPANGAQLGAEVAISQDGTLIAVGDDVESEAGNQSGAVYVYKYASGAWTEVQKIIPTDDNLYRRRFGRSIWFSGDNEYMIVGGPQWDQATSSPTRRPGRAYIFKWNSGTEEFDLQQELDSIRTNQENNDNFGYDVKLNSDGSLAFVSAWLDDHGTTSNSGAVFVFERSGTTWTQKQVVRAVPTTASEWVATTIAISDDGSEIFAGAPANDDEGSNFGKIYVFKNS